jgi:hypothetical protein
MKKIISVVLTISIILSLSLNAVAIEPSNAS